MEYIFYILFLVFLLFVVKKFLFASDENKEILEKEIMSKTLKEDLKTQEMIEDEIKKEVEVFYQLNVENIKLNLYPVSTFRNYQIRDSYQKIALDNYWINEPFYSRFTKILYYIDAQDLWIKSPKSEEIILNIRDQNGEIIKTNSLKVLDLKEVLYNIVVEVLKIKKQTRNFLSKENIQDIILPAIIYTLSKCGNLDVETTDENEIINILIEIFFSDFSEEFKVAIVPRNNLNFEVIVQIFERSIGRAREYPNTIYSKETSEKIVKKLQSFPKKQLICIE